jgi:glycosyltransferase involved in cell wall biosynthesis
MANRPRVLVLFSSLSPSMRRSALEIVSAAMERYEVQIFAPDRDAKSLRSAGVSVQTWKPTGLLTMLWAIDALRKTVKSYDPDMIHAFGFTAAAAGLGSVSRMMAARTLVTLHDPIPLAGAELPKAFVEKRLPLLLDRAGRIVCEHPTLAKEVSEHLGVPPERVEMIPPGVPAGPALEMRPKGRPGPILGFAGQLGPDKAWETALAAFAKVKADFPDAQLWIAGDGTLVQQVRSEARSLGVLEAISFFGDIGLAQLFAGIDLLVVPRGKDPHPPGFLEALVTGVPVVAANRGALADFIGERETGWLVTPDVEGFAAGIGDAWTHIDEAWLGAAAQRPAAAAEFDPVKIAERTLAIYGELLAAAPVRG